MKPTQLRGLRVCNQRKFGYLILLMTVTKSTIIQWALLIAKINFKQALAPGMLRLAPLYVALAPIVRGSLSDKLTSLYCSYFSQNCRATSIGIPWPDHAMS